MENCYRAEGHQFVEEENGNKVCIQCGHKKQQE